MQNPSSSDPSFKAFLDNLKEQNQRGFLTQLLQLKADREIAGEDGDKREEQLDEVISSLKDVKIAVTGIDISVDLTPLVNIGENQTSLLEELSRESALTRKLTEGSVEYDKEASQYRNTSGREIESVVSGKMSKKGGFLDFETARTATAGQGTRAREANQISLKPINYVPGKSVANVTNSSSNNTNNNSTVSSSNTETNEVKNFLQYLGDEITTGFKFFMTDGILGRSDKKERSAKVSSARQKPVSANPDSDNVVTSQEAIADNTKSDLEISKELLDTTKAQLLELKTIREALAPETPKELVEQKSAPSATAPDSESSGLPGLPGIDLPRRTPKQPVPSGPNKPKGKAPRGKVPTGGMGSKLSTGLKIGGGLLAGAGLVLGAYEASEFLAETKFGERMAAGEGQKAEKAFRENVAPTIDPIRAGVTKEQAQAALENGSPRDIEKLGGREALMRIAGNAPIMGVSTEQAQAARSEYARVDPRRIDTIGRTVSNTSIENTDMSRDAVKGGTGGGNTIVSNNINNTSTTKFVPMKASPRPEFTGSALDRYQSRISVY